MKSVTKYISIALILAAGLFSSCRKELAFSDSAADNQITVTATIANEGTKVSFVEDGTTLKSEWEATDNIVGWDEDGNVLELEIVKIDNNGAAVFKPVSGSAPIPTSGKVYMIYAPGKNYSNVSNKSLEYDLSSQSLTKVPALMTATGEVTGNVLSLTFKNELAIVAVKNPTFPVTAATTFSGLKISGDNINTVATFASNENGVTVTPSAKGAISRSCTIETNSSGRTSANVLFAVLPNSTTADVKVSTVNPEGYLISFTNKSFAAGKCYLLEETGLNKQTFAITVAEGITGGTVSTSHSGSVAWDTEVSVTATPDNGYELQGSISVTGASGSNIPLTGNKFTMPKEDVTVSATFSPVYTEGSFSAAGIKIDDVWWAPVNCGYDETASPNGKLYQWGRKYGQAYELGKISPYAWLSKDDDTAENADKFGQYDYATYNWFQGGVDNSLWSESSKGTKDPCPEGWKVPTIGQLESLTAHYSAGDNGGLWFSGTQEYSVSGPRIFFPANGCRDHSDGTVSGANSIGNYWSSTCDGDNAKFINIDGSPDILTYVRADGYSVRCVKE